MSDVIVGCCGPHVLHDCTICGDDPDGIVHLPDGPIPCPHCQPEAYPDGFPGVMSPLGTWTIPPSGD